MKIALVHDYLAEYGGAERVLEALHELYPDAPVYTAFVNQKGLGIHWSKFADWDLRETWLSKIPWHTKLYSPLRIWAPKYFKDLDLSAYDVVISSSNAYFAKAVRVPNGVHLCYCHTPARSLYGYTTMSNWQSNPLTRVPGQLINHFLRMVDFEVAQEVDQFIANSQETAFRIEKFYRRDSVIVYPPVRIPEKSPQRNNQAYYLYVNRLALAKHPELAVQACNSLKLPLKVVGEGKMLHQLKQQAGPTIELLGAVDDKTLSELYAGAQALLYPVEDEDFGIVPVEAMGYGVPVIAHNSGGPKETVIDGKTGVLFDQLSAAGLQQAIKRAEDIQFVPEKIHQHAQKFSVNAFKKNIQKLVKTAKKHS
ncbi:MAG: glycosyltransferase [Patescibacteria group bacterium]